MSKNITHWVKPTQPSEQTFLTPALLKGAMQMTPTEQASSTYDKQTVPEVAN